MIQLEWVGYDFVRVLKTYKQFLNSFGNGVVHTHKRFPNKFQIKFHFAAGKSSESLLSIFNILIFLDP